MVNIALTVAYRGTHYAGWQIQPNAPSIQAAIVKAIAAVTGETVSLNASGRTDAGVHAEAQVANFNTDSTIPPQRFALALNTKLPRDIRILSSVAVAPTFHSRYDAQGKTYCYRLYLGVVDSPFYHDYTWHIKENLMVDAMKKGAEAFMGTHDFKGFMSTGSSVKTTIRTIYRIHLAQEGPLVTLSYTGSGFLYNMVRIITGTLVAVGKGQISPEELPAIIQSGERSRAGITAPARGLMLQKVFYDNPYIS